MLRKRADGYHDLDTCFYTVPFTDVLEIIPAGGDTAFSSSGVVIPGNSADNLVLKAYRLLNEKYGLPPATMHLHKVIPTGAGLGGGSSDAAHALKLLNNVFELNITERDLADFAASLGSDCPYFIYDSPMMGAGRGELLSPAQVSLSGTYLVLLNPGLHVSTAVAFSGVTPAEDGPSVTEVLSRPMSSWQGALVNDFEASVFKSFPFIETLKNEMLAAGAVYAAMTGSGASVFGLFDKKIDSDSFLWKKYCLWEGHL